MNGRQNKRCALVRYSGRRPFNRCQDCDRMLRHCFVFRSSLISLAVIVTALLAIDQASPFSRLAVIFIIVALIVLNLDINRETNALVRSRKDSRDLLEERDALLEEARRSRDFYTTMFDSVRESILVIDRDYRIVKANRQALRNRNLNERQCMGEYCYVISHRNSVPCKSLGLACPLEEVFVTGRAIDLTHVHYDGNGRPLYEEISATPIKNDAGEVIQVIEVLRDITEKKRAQQALAAEKERLAVTLRSIGDGVICTDTAGNITLLNKVAEELTGWLQDQAMGRPWSEVFQISDGRSGSPLTNLLDEILGEGKTTGLARNTILVSKDGRKRNIADAGTPIRDRENNIIGAVLVFRDITDQLQTEKELLKMQKLESIGVLAGGIAHDFNNLLTGILGNIDLAGILARDDNEKLRHYLKEAKKATRRASHLTSQLLTFARGGEPIREKASITEVIHDSADFLLRGSNIACHYDMPDDLWPAMIDRNQISQVIQNIIVNARQSMPKGGVITIACGNFVKTAESPLPLAAGNYIRVNITDQGVGIPSQFIDRIFEPYFSTKQTGSGLGLAVSHSIISKHGGYIKVASTPGQGTTFSLYLPAATAQPAAGDSQDEKTKKLTGGQGTVLVMDDEEMVRNLAGEMLSHLGFTPIFAADGDEAIAVYRQRLQEGNPVDVVIMDLTVPGGMGGQEAVRHILDMDARARVIVSSGYSNDPVMADYRQYGFTGAVVKPYEITEMDRVLREVLGKKG